jgi:diguanylate cyclase (GGDEF)-like protein/PAS domain S-box-containing protein
VINLKSNHWLGLSALLLIISFFFYKSIAIEAPFNNSLDDIKELHDLQILLHREILRYRNNQAYQYDPLNRSISQVLEANRKLTVPDTSGLYPELSKAISQLKATIAHQEILVEDFKTHHSILQNSLIYYSRMSKEIYGSKTKNYSHLPGKVLGKLSSLVLEYSGKPKHEIALKIFPIIDSLNHNPTKEINTLINHSLMIIEKLPEIDVILEIFNTLNTEQKINDIRKKMLQITDEHREYVKIYSSLLFICSLYLVFYIVFLFVSLQRNRNTLSIANQKLNTEVEERTKTEKTLYTYVEGSSNNIEDSIEELLRSLCKSLKVRYAYLTYVSPGTKEATLAGLVDNEEYKSNIRYEVKDTPCEDVLREGRLVYNRDLRLYYPDWTGASLKDAESYIGVTLLDNDNDITGILAIAHDTSIENTNLAESIVALAASRASTELSRQLALKNSERYQKGLELIDTWIAKLISAAMNAEFFYESICRAALEITNASLSALPLYNKATSTYKFNSAIGHNAESLQDFEFSIGDGGMCAWAMLNKSNLRIDDIRSDIRAKKQMIDQFNIQSAMVTPIIINNKAYGAISVFKNDSAFDEIDERLLTQLSHSVQMAITNMQLLNEVESERERAEVTLHSIADAVITTSAEGNIEYMNNVAEQLTGWPLNEVINEPVQVVFRILDRDTREPMHNLVEACLEDGTSIRKSMTTLISKNGTEKEIESSMSPIIKLEGKPEGSVIVFHDETERRHMEHVIMHQATHDSLTGLANRNEFDKQLNEHIYDAKNYGRQHALCYLDLDRFKLVNDTSGHAAGDALLKQVTSLLHTRIRGGDILGRLGGDEFGLILENCPQENAVKVAEKIINDIDDHQFTWDGNTFAIGASIGLVPLTSATDNATDVMKKADMACYTAKDNGRNKVYVYHDEDLELMRRHDEIHWATRIEDALSQNRLRLYGQKIRPISKNVSDIIHLEILVRMEDDDKNLIEPNAFIPAAERFNLMSKVDKQIIKGTFEFVASIKSRVGNNIRYSINLSGNSLNDENFSLYIKEQLVKFDINPDCICFEVTETATITNLHMARKLMAEIKALGCWFALDDFGSGLSSFEYLKNLPVDYLKIDGCFVRDMVNNKIDHAMVAAINQIGHVMGIQTIAEFVENDQIMHKLKKLGVDYAQGYAISRPTPLEDIDIDDLLSSTGLSAGCA